MLSRVTFQNVVCNEMLSIYFKRSYNVAQAFLEFVIYLPLLSERWGYRCTSLCLKTLIFATANWAGKNQFLL